jgi:hypothetical protein
MVRGYRICWSGSVNSSDKQEDQQSRQYGESRLPNPLVPWDVTRGNWTWIIKGIAIMFTFYKRDSTASSKLTAARGCNIKQKFFEQVMRLPSFKWFSQTFELAIKQISYLVPCITSYSTDSHSLILVRHNLSNFLSSASITFNINKNCFVQYLWVLIRLSPDCIWYAWLLYLINYNYQTES